jgi:hypothetical protein
MFTVPLQKKTASVLAVSWEFSLRYVVSDREPPIYRHGLWPVIEVKEAVAAGCFHDGEVITHAPAG